MTRFMTNDFRDEFRDELGHVRLAALSALRGQSFDRNNDLWIDHDGKHIIPRNGEPISIAALGILGATTDALMAWERNTNGEAAFLRHYGDDPTECGFAA